MLTKQASKPKTETEQPQAPALFPPEDNANKAGLADIWLPLSMVLSRDADTPLRAGFLFQYSDLEGKKKIAHYQRGEGGDFLAADEDGTCYKEDQETGSYKPITREAALSKWPDLLADTSRESIEDVEFVQTQQAQPSSAMTRYEPSQLIALAIERNLDVEKLRELMALEREWRADKTKAEFAVAMARFGEIKQIVQHNRTGKTAGNANFSYSDFPATVRAVSPWLTQCGLSFTHRQDPPVMAEAKVSYVMVYCCVRHASGYSEETPYPAIPDLRLEGKVSPSQLIQLAITYAKRQTLCMGLGLATAEDADDLDSQAPVDDGPITEQQVEEMQAIIKAVDANLERFLAHMKVERLENIPLSKYGMARRDLEAKQKQQQSVNGWKCTSGNQKIIEGFRNTLLKKGMTEKALQDDLFELFPEDGIKIQALSDNRAQLYASHLAKLVNPK